ncbi:arylsulfatase B [Drosophila albomicans]|uniref:Arylsulfatase B n=1 Tax=Drosophila albomicans TaxID=7291 RepID=A0A6P8Y742_DROAB|nr:arylsulfatase B [Drosophila albomicans]XP_034104308.1 arylsulfatase B [Drosophila albomicans]XP_034104309.1 arylsulfatase B [Drosophila albomicans]
MQTLVLLLALILALTLAAGQDDEDEGRKPHIIIIMADDLGFDDVSFRGSNRFLTPNIDALAYNGVIINDLYTPAMCTPSRAALLTGKYPINTGMQQYVIVNDQPWGLPLNETTMAQIFRSSGYRTNLLGKWHLGMFQRNYTPTERGFDHHLGYLGAYVDYYDQTYQQNGKPYARGHDFRNDLKVSRDQVGHYVTDVLTDAAVELITTHNASAQPLFLLLSHLAPHAANTDDPMQAPMEELAQFEYLTNITERYYAAMVSRLDKSVGRVIDALAQQQMLEHSIVLFLSDNGGPTLGEHSTTASNYPLRGQKHSPWEGGIRSSAAIWSKRFSRLGRVWRQRFYIGDVLPTLAAAAGIQLNSSLQLDGLNLWPALMYDYDAVEREIVHNIDNSVPYVSYVHGRWKFVNGTTSGGQYDGWLSVRHNQSDPRADHYEEVIRNTSVWQQLQELRGNLASINISSMREEATVKCREPQPDDVPCLPLEGLCVFDMDEDPCEQNNIYEKMRDGRFITEYLQRIEEFNRKARPPGNKPADPQCDPRYYNNEWTWWQDERNAGVSRLPMYFEYFLVTLMWIWWSY